jgi:terminase small subunit-like protein
MALTWGLRDARHIAFVNEYLKCGNGTQAAIAAGYAPSDARVRASKLRRYPKIQQAIHSELARFAISRERVLEEYAALAFGDVGDVAEWDESGVRLIPKRQLSRRARRLIKKIKDKPGEFGSEREVEVRDPYPALEVLGKLTGAIPPQGTKFTFPDGTTVEGDAPILIYHLPDNARQYDPASRPLTPGLLANVGPPPAERPAD